MTTAVPSPPSAPCGLRPTASGALSLCWRPVRGEEEEEEGGEVGTVHRLMTSHYWRGLGRKREGAVRSGPQLCGTGYLMYTGKRAEGTRKF